MKRLQFFLFAVIIGSLTVFTSCKSDNNDDDNMNLEPTLNFTGGAGFISDDATVESKEIFKIGVTAFSNTTSGEKLENFKVTAIANNNPVPDFAVDSNFSAESFQWQNQYTIEVTGTTAVDVNFIFRITDKDGKYIEKNITVTVEPAGNPIYEYTDKVMGSYNAAEGSSFASADGNTYNMQNAQANSAKIDWMYSYGNTDKASLFAPSDALAVYFFGENNMNAFATKNDTKFKVVTETVDWNNIIDDSQILVYTASGVTATGLTDLQVGDVIAFITDADKPEFAGKHGLIRILAFETNNAGTITFDVKVQQ